MSSSSPLPPSDQIVLALWRAGDARAAATFASQALARQDRRRAQVRTLLEAIREGRAAPAAAPDEEAPALDLSVAAALVDRYRYPEARTVLRARGLENEPTGRRLGTLLDEALAPFPAEADASFAAVLHLVEAGQGPSALRALEEVERQSVAPAGWLTARTGALGALVRGDWKSGPVPVEAVTRDTVVARIRARDLPGALDAARAAGAGELAAILERLVSATERVFAERDEEEDGLEPSTVPMEGHRLCEFQIRMGVLSKADRGYRAILKARPDDDVARARLGDVVALRRALGESPEPVPPRRPRVSWLDKNAPRSSAGWSPGSNAARYPRFGDEDGEESTDVLAPAQEAELLLKLGKAEAALDMYRILAIRHPRQHAHRKRIAEIEALIAQRMTSAVTEVTARHDLSDLQRRAVPTKPNVRLPEMEHPRFDESDDDASTVVDAIPEDLRRRGPGGVGEG